MKIVIGIDPDSDKHGVAFYSDGKLTDLKPMRLIDLANWLKGAPEPASNITVHMEDVCGVSAAFGGRDYKSTIHVRLKMAQKIGMCKQSQVEVERLCEHLNITLVKHKISKSWKDAKAGKAMFEKVTGWKGRSNEDTRSAAYFGFLGCK